MISPILMRLVQEPNKCNVTWCRGSNKTSEKEINKYIKLQKSCRLNFAFELYYQGQVISYQKLVLKLFLRAFGKKEGKHLILSQGQTSTSVQKNQDERVINFLLTTIDLYRLTM